MAVGRPSGATPLSLGKAFAVCFVDDPLFRPAGTVSRNGAVWV